jgi:hypothetical protein
VAHVQRRHTLAVCQNNLRESYQALATYADQREHRFPRIGEEPPRNVAAAYVPILAEAGCLPDGVAPVCPLRPATQADRLAPAPPAIPDTGYAYSLGYRDRTGQLHGLALDSAGADNEYLPIMADLPAAAGHQSGQNVLFIGGHVRYCTSSHAGVNGDEIYRNQIFRVAAGLHRLDTSLADGNTCP